MASNSLQALIFDVDGTLADTERDGHRVAFNRAFTAAKIGWNWTPELYGNLLAVTGGKERIRHYINNHSEEGLSAPVELTDELAADLHAAKQTYYRELLEAGKVNLRPGVARLIDEARDSGVRLAIATTTTPENVDLLVRHTLGSAALDWFEVIGAGDMVPAKKPAPDIYFEVLRQLRLNPTYALAIEDSAHGLAAATQAGLKTLITINGYTCDQDFSQAAAVVDCLGEPGNPAIAQQGGQPPNGVVDLAFLTLLLGSQ